MLRGSLPCVSIFSRPCNAVCHGSKIVSQESCCPPSMISSLMPPSDLLFCPRQFPFRVSTKATTSTTPRIDPHPIEAPSSIFPPKGVCVCACVCVCAKNPALGTSGAGQNLKRLCVSVSSSYCVFPVFVVRSSIHGSDDKMRLEHQTSAAMQ